MTKCVSVKMHTEDKVDNQSNNSASSSDSGVITDEKFMSNTTQGNVNISTTITCENSDATDSTIDIENLLNLAKNVCPSKKKSANEAATKTKSVTPLTTSSPTPSIRSTNISITSLQSDAVSSVMDSDTDEFEDSNGNYTIKKLGQQTALESRDADIPHIGGSDGLVLLQQRIDGDHMGAVATLSSPSSSALATPSTPQVGNMAFTNSTDITIGQKNYYQGPVTIQQFLIENRKNEGGSSPGGTDNPAFQNPSPTSDRRKPSNEDVRPKPYKFIYDRRIAIITAVSILFTIGLGVAFIVANSLDSDNHAVSTTTTDAFKTNNAHPQPYKFIFNRRAAIITAVIIILTIALGVVFATSSSVVKRKSSDNIGGGKYLRIVPRNDWLAEPASEPLTKLRLPVHRVVISHTATEDCVSQATCSPLTKSIQYFHKYSRNYSDVAYNFLVGGDGCVYEGRGWDDQGAHTKGYNVDSNGIAFIGTFTQKAPPVKQLNAAKLLIEEGVRLNKIVADYRLYGARQLVSTESPGEALYAIIKNWPNWSSEV